MSWRTAPSTLAWLLSAAAALALGATQTARAAEPELVWETTFLDDFDGPEGALPPSANWRFSIGHGYPGGPPNWGTGEIAYHTDDPANVSLDGEGHLRITALRDAEGEWTSARIETNRADFRAPEGAVMRIEGRIALPDVTGFGALGYWPAFWGLGAPYRENFGWPAVGEFDIMESVNGVNLNWGVLHCGTASGGPCDEPAGIGATKACAPDPCPGNFHAYAFEWDAMSEPSELRWYLDGELFHSVSEADLPAATWDAMASHQGFFLILNVAIGGGFPSEAAGMPTPHAATEPGHPMVVDYVAVRYGRPAPPNEPPEISLLAADPVLGEAPLEVAFDVQASDPDGDELAYEWDFGDGSPTSSEEDPTHTYTEPGEYEATVTVSDGTDEVTDSVTIQVGEAPAGAPQLAVAVKPKSKTVARRKRQVAYRVVLRNTGDAGASGVRVCARVNRKRLAVVGRACRAADVPAGARRGERFGLRIKPAARGKRIRIRFAVSGAGVAKRVASATLRVRR